MTCVRLEEDQDVDAIRRVNVAAFGGSVEADVFIMGFCRGCERTEEFCGYPGARHER
jgi:hypothetical protein